MTIGEPVIRAASEDELERLSEFFQEPPAPGGSYHVAVKGRFDRIIGFLCVTDPGERPGEARFRWRIVPRYAGSALEERLVERAIAHARASGASALATMDMLGANGARDRLLEGFGFTVALADELYEVDLAAFHARAKAACLGLEQHGDLPSGAAVVPLDARNWPDAARLAIAHGLLAPDYQQASLEQSGFSSSVSAVLGLHGALAGALLVRIHGSVAEIAALVVERALRTGMRWANTLLTERSAEWAGSAGIEVLRFRCHPTMSRGIQNLARRCGGRMIARQHARVFPCAAP